MRRFGGEPGLPSGLTVMGISGDGTTLVGVYGPSAFRYRGPGTFETIGFGSSYEVPYRPLSVSEDGRVVCGYGREYRSPGFSLDTALRWDGAAAAGRMTLGQARVVSGDGSIVAGCTVYTDSAWLWTAAGGFSMLERPSRQVYSTITVGAMNSDGRLVAGSMHGGNSSRGVLWRDGSAQEIVPLAGYAYCTARAMSEDGSVVAFGLSRNNPGYSQAAGLWTAGAGMVPMADYLRGAGVSLPEGWVLTDCTGISADGMTFTGAAWDGTGTVRGFVAVIPAPAGSLVLAGPALAAVRRRRGRAS